MEKMTFKATINAPREKVWETLWGDETYRKWTVPFSPDSQVTTDWKQGSKAIFHDGTGSGMVAVIEENRQNEFMSIKHLGMIKDGVEDLDSAEVRDWAGAHENYTLTESGGATELVVDIDITEKYKEMFEKMWPKALAELKTLAEQN